MARPPAIDFQFFSPASLRTLDHDEQRRALRDELRRRQRANAAKVERGDLRSDHAATDEARWEEVLADVTERHAGIDPARHYQFSWADKLNALRGEIMRRRANFPKLLEQQRITEHEAQFGIAVMECAHRWYWAEGLAFGNEFVVPRDAAATYERLREEEARRHAWEQTGGLDNDKLHRVTVDGTVILQVGPGPFTVHYQRDPSQLGLWRPATVRNAGGDPMFGAKARIVPLIERLDAEARTQTMIAIAAAFNRQAAERLQLSPTDDAQQEAA